MKRKPRAVAISPDRINYCLIGEKIKEARKNKDFTQEELSEIVGVTPAFIGHIERGERSVSLNTLLKIALTLNLSMDYIFNVESLTPDEEIITQFRQLVSDRPSQTQIAIMDIIRTSLKYLD